MTTVVVISVIVPRGSLHWSLVTHGLRQRKQRKLNSAESFTGPCSEAADLRCGRSAHTGVLSLKLSPQSHSQGRAKTPGATNSKAYNYTSQRSWQDLWTSGERKGRERNGKGRDWKDRDTCRDISQHSLECRPQRCHLNIATVPTPSHLNRHCD